MRHRRDLYVHDDRVIRGYLSDLLPYGFAIETETRYQTDRMVTEVDIRITEKSSGQSARRSFEVSDSDVGRLFNKLYKNVRSCLDELMLRFVPS